MMTYPLAILVFSDLVITLRSGRTEVAHEAIYQLKVNKKKECLNLTGLGEPSTSTRHMRQLPATESLSW